jgi:TPR repeat protein
MPISDRIIHMLFVLAVMSVVGHHVALAGNGDKIKAGALTQASLAVPPVTAPSTGSKSGETAIAALTRQADEGDIYAKWRLAEAYARGLGAKRDLKRAYHLFVSVAQHHNPTDQNTTLTSVTVEAMMAVAGYLRKGSEGAGIPRQPRRAFRIYQYIAMLYSHPRAQYVLGQMYLKGEGVRRDVRRGMRWLNLAARKSYAAAQAALGEYFLKQHKNGKSDRSKGLAWLLLAKQNARGKNTRQSLAARYDAVFDLANKSERIQAHSLAENWANNKTR